MTGFSDPQIAAIVQVANEGEIELGQLARTRAMNEEVREFAQRMVDEHTDVNRRQQELLGRIGVQPVENDQSRQLRAEAMQARQMLENRPAMEFDRAYMDVQVSQHMRVLSLIDGTLLPNVRDAEYRSFLQELRGKVAEHQQTAAEIRGRIVTP